MPSSPTVFSRSGQRVVAIGSKNGAFFLLDPANLNLLACRQLLPYVNDDPAQPIPGVDPDSAGGPGENHSGTYSCAAVHWGLGILYVGLGGWGGSIDANTTPFVRALNWGNLQDAWPNAVGGDGVRRYTAATPPVYSTAGEVAIGSAAVVNDLVFVPTTKPGLYALDAGTGLCMWSAPGLPPGPLGDGSVIMGPAIFGEYVVVGCRGNIYVYHLRSPWRSPTPWWELVAINWPIFPPNPPPPPPNGYRHGPGPVDAGAHGQP
jgi:outer membrane protein assembly factor BamB